jgi:hypothetical protein
VLPCSAFHFTHVPLSCDLCPAVIPLIRGMDVPDVLTSGPRWSRNHPSHITIRHSTDLPSPSCGFCCQPHWRVPLCCVRMLVRPERPLGFEGSFLPSSSSFSCLNVCHTALSIRERMTDLLLLHLLHPLTRDRHEHSTEKILISCESHNGVRTLLISWSRGSTAVLLSHPFSHPRCPSLDFPVVPLISPYSHPDLL